MVEDMTDIERFKQISEWFQIPFGTVLTSNIFPNFILPDDVHNNANYYLSPELARRNVDLQQSIKHLRKEGLNIFDPVPDYYGDVVIGFVFDAATTKDDPVSHAVRDIFTRRDLLFSYVPNPPKFCKWTDSQILANYSRTHTPNMGDKLIGREFFGYRLDYEFNDSAHMNGLIRTMDKIVYVAVVNYDDLKDIAHELFLCDGLGKVANVHIPLVKSSEEMSEERWILENTLITDVDIVSFIRSTVNKIYPSSSRLFNVIAQDEVEITEKLIPKKSCEFLLNIDQKKDPYDVLTGILLDSPLLVDFILPDVGGSADIATLMTPLYKNDKAILYRGKYHKSDNHMVGGMAFIRTRDVVSFIKLLKIHGADQNNIKVAYSERELTTFIMKHSS